MAKFNPTLSVITIVYNNVRDIERTLLSVINQSYTPIQYIVVDGLSTDGTLGIIRQYGDKISHLISENDKGIYDAMNKGLAVATGDYVVFMNSGDEFYDNQTVARVFASQPNADIYYGETEMINHQLQSLGRRRHKAPDRFTWRSFKYGMSVSHQAIYIRRAIAGPYDTKYQLSADIDWIIRAARKASSIVKVEGYVAKYLVGGMSKARHKQSMAERFAIMRHYYGLVPTVFNHAVIAFNLAWHRLWHKTLND